MKWGLGPMGIRPKDFWKYSLREWNHALKGYIQSLGGDDEPEAMDRTDLDDLMRHYPDVGNSA